MSKKKRMSGANMVEYSLLAALISVTLIVAVRGFSRRVQCRFNAIGNSISNPALVTLYESTCASGGMVTP